MIQINQELFISLSSPTLKESRSYFVFLPILKTKYELACIIVE